MTLRFNKRTLTFILLISLFFLPNLVVANGYTSLVGLPGLEDPNNISLQEYINALLRIAIILAAIIAVVKLMLAGAQYILTALINEKANAKADIKSALIGLLIIIGAVTILREINPNLVSLSMLPPAPSYYDSYVPPVKTPAISDCTIKKDSYCTVYYCGTSCDEELKKCTDSIGYLSHTEVEGTVIKDEFKLMCYTGDGGATPESSVDGVETASHIIDRDTARDQTELIADSYSRNVPLVQVDVEGSTSEEVDNFRDNPSLRTAFEEKCKNGGGTKVSYSAYNVTRPATLYPFCYK
jgi:hypothetical protein